jgi:hypothetical protein
MRDAVLICLALVLAFVIYSVVAAVLVVNAMAPALASAAAGAAQAMLFEVIIVLVVSLAAMALLQGLCITRVIFGFTPEGVVFVTGLVFLFETLKEFLRQSP